MLAGWLKVMQAASQKCNAWRRAADPGGGPEGFVELMWAQPTPTAVPACSPAFGPSDGGVSRRMLQ